MLTRPDATPKTHRGIDKRAALIDIGTAIFTQKGFSHTALDELVKAAGVPKGSFYYYFESKNAFAQLVIRNYADYFAHKLDRHLLDRSLSPVARLKAFAEDAKAGVIRYEFRRGCLVGNLGQEMASLDEEFRVSLSAVMRDWQQRFQICIDEGKAIGEIHSAADSASLAQFFWSAWEGAILCTRLEKSTQPLDNISTIFFDFLLSPKSSR